jgi:hypothetical protein
MDKKRAISVIDKYKKAQQRFNKLNAKIVKETECIECGAVINSRIKKARCKRCV